MFEEQARERIERDHGGKFATTVNRGTGCLCCKHVKQDGDGTWRCKKHDKTVGDGLMGRYCDDWKHDGESDLTPLDAGKKSRDQAAAAVGVSGRTVQDAEFVHTHARRRITPARDRRNLTDADIVRLVAQLDKRRTKAEAGAMKGKQAQGCASSGKSAVETAAVIGVSTRKVEQARAVLDSAEPDKAAVVALHARSGVAAVRRGRRHG